MQVNVTWPSHGFTEPQVRTKCQNIIVNSTYIGDTCFDNNSGGGTSSNDIVQACINDVQVSPVFLRNSLLVSLSSLCISGVCEWERKTIDHVVNMCLLTKIVKCILIFAGFAPFRRELNFQQNPYNISHFTLTLVPHYLGKFKTLICLKKPEHVHPMINCQNTWFVNNLACPFICYS